MSTKIEWTDETINPVTGCSQISEGCQNCYAKRAAWGPRLRGKFGYPQDDPFRPGTLHLDKLEQVKKWRKPRKIFVCSMADLFHHAVPFDTIDRILYTAVFDANQHTYLLLTKRPRRMAEYFASKQMSIMKNVWLGVTAENQARANERIPILLSIPAAVRFVSIEPMLGPVDLDRAIYGPPPRKGMNAFGHTDGFGHEANINWVICGGETGPGARLMELHWSMDLALQCSDAKVPFFFKGHGTHPKSLHSKKSDPKYRWLGGQEWNEFPRIGE